MCENAPCARDIGQRIADEPSRIAEYDELDDLTGAEFDRSCVRDLTESVIGNLDIKNEYYRRRMWRILQSLTDAYPVPVAEFTPLLLEITSYGDEQDIEEFGAILYPLLEQGLRLPDLPDRRYITALQEADPAACRKAAIELFRRRGRRADLAALIDMASYETGEMAERSERATRDLIGQSVTELQATDGEHGLENDAAANVRYVAYNNPDLLEDHVDSLFKLLGTGNADIAILALAEVVTSLDATGQRVVDTLLSDVEIDESITAGGSVDVGDTTFRRAEDALETLLRAGQAGECSTYLISRANEWLESDSLELHEHALTQLRVLAERDPESIEAHIETVSKLAADEGEESSLAGRVLSRYGQAQSHDELSYLQEVCNTHEEGSIVAHLANTVGCLRYRLPGQTSYDSFEIDAATDRALANIATAAVEGQTLPAVWPAYEPRAVVLIALELALRGLRSGDDIVVFSPGGGNHWGNKGDLRSEFANYGLAVSEGTDVVPLPDIVPHSRIDDGEVVPMSDGRADTSVVFSKRLGEIRALDTIDTLLPNLTARTKESYEENIDTLVDDFDEIAVVPLYTNYTKHEFEERRAPRYGPPRDVENADTLPGLDALEAAADTTSVESDYPGTFSNWLDSATQPQRVTIVGIDDDGLLNYLTPGYEASTELREYDENRAAGRIFSRQLMFERLPFPIDRYDEWVRTQRDGYFGPRTVDTLIDKLEERAEDVIGRPAIAGHLFDTADALRRARREIGDENPMYEELRARLQSSLEAGETAAVFLPKATWCRAFEQIAVDDGVVSQSDIDSGRVTFVSPDSSRDLQPVERLFVVGPQRPQYAGFYVTPAAEETVVFTYRGNWEWMIERDAERFVETKNAAAPGIDYAPYPEPEIEVELEVEPETVSESVGEAETAPGSAAPGEAPSSGEQQAPEPGSRASAGPDREDLAQLFDQSRPVDYETGGSSRYDDQERKEFEIETASGERFKRRDTVIRHREVPSANQQRYHWISPGALREGDEVAILDEGVFQQRWDDWLSDVYKDEHGETNTFDGLRTWYETLSDILRELADDAGVDDVTHNIVRRQIESRTHDFDRQPATVWRWFDSIASADDALDLARDPSLTIGPRRADDIAAVGEEFDREDLVGENALRIEESMSRIRSTNMQQGHRFRSELVEEMNSLENAELRDDATVYEVGSVTEL